MSKEKLKIVPELRFPEFENGWEKVKLKDVSTYFNGKSFEGAVQKNGNYELITLKSIDASGNLVHSKRYINDEVPTLTQGTLVMILSEQAPGLLGMTAIIPKKNKYVLNQRVAEIRPNSKVESYFLSKAINSNQTYFSRLGAGMKVQNISKPNVENYEFCIPTISEQQKIANCLSSLDEVITAETEKLDLLQNHKKGLLQQLFPQEGETQPQYRFPEFENDGDWEEKEIDELGNTISGLRGKKGADFGSGKPYVTYKQVFGSTFVKFEECKKVNVLNSENQNVLKKGDILFTTSSETPHEVGFASVLVEEPEKTTYLNSFCFALRPSNLEELLPKFSRFLFHSKNYREKVTLIAQGSTRFNLSKSAFIKLKLRIPESKEQQKIANCLSSADDLIESQTQKIKGLKKHKKGLMQQLFPTVNP